jgi:ribosomal protein S18 acetylase RimI-like enzyme
MNPLIRTATVHDAPAIAALVNSAYRGEYAKRGWTTEADLLDGSRTDAAALIDLIEHQNTFILLYHEGDTLLSCVLLEVHGKKLYLGMLTVEPAHQGSGLGKKMLCAAEEFAHQQGCISIYMNVITTRTELIEWYERHGYQDTGERKPFAFNDPRFGIPKMPLEFMVMEKPLPKVY